MKRFVLAALAAMSAGCVFHREKPLPAPIPKISGDQHGLFELRYVDFMKGTGAPFVERKCLFVHYTGWLTNGTKFDSSRDPGKDSTPGKPLGFPQGVRAVIPGWDYGFMGMRVGGQRRLYIPFQLGYGYAGSPPDIPPKAELIFDVELMGVADTLPRTPPANPPAPGGRGGGARPMCPTWAVYSDKK